MKDRWLEVLSAPGIMGETVPAGQGRCYEKNQGKNNKSLFAKFAKENVFGQSSLWLSTVVNICCLVEVDVENH